MEEIPPFEAMVNDSFDRLNELHMRHQIERLENLEQRLKILDEDLSELLDRHGERSGEKNQRFLNNL